MQMFTPQRTLCAIALTTTGSLALAAGQAQVPAATNAATNAVDRTQVVPVFRAEAFMADEIVRPAMHPPIDQIPALPMPTPDQDLSAPGSGPGSPIYYDQITGEVMEFPGFQPRGGPSSGKGGGFVGADGITGFDEYYAPRGFGTMSLISDATRATHPWRMNVKLVQEYIDAGTGAASYFVCSGAMQDASMVLTAGHCVYNRDNDSTGNDFGWADRVWVYPGWDGDGLTLGNPGVLDNYGWGVSTGLWSWTGWTVNGDFDWDMGLIRLDRAVGMLTGWFGYRWADGCSTLGLTFHNASYPAEGCGQPGLHNGQDMYYWFGRFDACVGDNQLHIDTTAGCFTALWGGQSGSNVYDIDGDSRFAHGVASNSNRTTSGNYTRLWGGFKDFMNDTVRPATRGTAFDIEALQVRVTPTTILAGQSTSTANAQVPNPTDANPASASYGFNVYLSTNNNISTSDTLLADRSYTWDYAPMQNLTLNTGNVTIPKNTPSGTYWVGIVIDDQDTNYGNNDSDLWDAQQITVNGIADIVANTCTAPSGTAYHGDTISVGYNVSNEGGDPSNSVTLDVYASTNTDISTFDTFLGTVNIGTFSGSQTKTGSVNVTLPSSLSGDYYIGYIVSATDDYYVDQNNEAYDGVVLNVQGRSNLFANSFDSLDNQAIPGGSIDIAANIRNNGTIASGTYTVNVYASTNTIISGADTLLGTFNRPSLAAGGSVNLNGAVSFPGFMAPGQYYVGMIVSPGINENNTADNTAYDSTRVTVVDCPVDFDNSGLLDLADIVAFGQLFQSQSPLVDFDNNNLWDLADIVTFVNLFTAGCP